MLGNAIKVGVHFVSYDYFKGLLADPQVSTALYLSISPSDTPQGKVSALKSLVGQCTPIICLSM